MTLHRTGHRTRLGVAALIGLIAASSSLPAPAQTSRQVVNVYSGRHYNTDKALYAKFTAQTGIKVNLLEGKDDELIVRLRTEGANSPADVLVLVDAARIQRAREQNLFRPIRSTALNRDVPASLRDPQGHWFALTRRVRPIMVNPAIVKPSQVRSYADLAKPALKGKLCLRNRASVYNQSLVADVLTQRGAAATRQWIAGMVANVKPPFFTSDTPMLRALGRGECGVTVANQYYLARMLSPEASAEDRKAAANVRVVFPSPAHVNITAAGVTRSSKNPQAATRLIEFLASPTSGEGYASANNEYPLRGFGNNPILNRMGSFRASPVTADQLARRNREATDLMARNGWQ